MTGTSLPSGRRSAPDDRTTAQRRARNRSLLRDGIVVVLAVVGLGASWAVREVPNEDFPVAVELVQRLDTTFRDVRAGELDVGIAPEVLADGIMGARFESATLEDRWMLTDEAGSDCYVLWWDSEGVRRVRTLPSGSTCEPSATAMSPDPSTFGRIGRAVDEEGAGIGQWRDVLPAPVRLRYWFLPALIVGGGIGLAALVRVSIALLTGDAPSATRR